MKKDLQEYLDNVIENVKDYAGKSFTYACIIYDAFNYDEKLRGYYLPFELKEQLETLFDENFNMSYLDNLEESRLKEKLLYAKTELILEILDIAEIQEYLDNILDDEENENDEDDE